MYSCLLGLIFLMLPTVKTAVLFLGEKDFILPLT